MLHLISPPLGFKRLHEFTSFVVSIVYMNKSGRRRRESRKWTILITRKRGKRKKWR